MGVSRRQIVLHMDYEAWEVSSPTLLPPFSISRLTRCLQSAIEAYNITESIIPHREEPTKVQVSGSIECVDPFDNRD
jgi:hypothetical protein